ncbi:mucin-22-like [Watersipora subatra]|uniref:mucin-22-like n=1 Tax=Watersipora subatra TaxID=2589382 RepID=UPI00355B9A10
MSSIKSEESRAAGLTAPNIYATTSEQTLASNQAYKEALIIRRYLPDSKLQTQPSMTSYGIPVRLLGRLISTETTLYQRSKSDHMSKTVTSSSDTTSSDSSKPTSENWNFSLEYIRNLKNHKTRAREQRKGETKEFVTVSYADRAGFHNGDSTEDVVRPDDENGNVNKMQHSRTKYSTEVSIFVNKDSEPTTDFIEFAQTEKSVQPKSSRALTSNVSTLQTTSFEPIDAYQDFEEMPTFMQNHRFWMFWRKRRNKWRKDRKRNRERNKEYMRGKMRDNWKEKLQASRLESNKTTEKQITNEPKEKDISMDYTKIGKPTATPSSNILSDRTKPQLAATKVSINIFKDTTNTFPSQTTISSINIAQTIQINNKVNFPTIAQTTNFKVARVSAVLTKAAQMNGNKSNAMSEKKPPAKFQATNMSTMSKDLTELKRTPGNNSYTRENQATTSISEESTKTEIPKSSKLSENESTTKFTEYSGQYKTTKFRSSNILTESPGLKPASSYPDFTKVEKVITSRISTTAEDNTNAGLTSFIPDNSIDFTQASQTSELDLTTLLTDATKPNTAVSSMEYQMTAQGTDFESTDTSSDITQTSQTTGLDLTTLSTKQDSALGSTVYTIPGQATTVKSTTLSTDNINTAQGTDFESTDTSSDITQTAQTTGLDLTTLSTAATKQNPLFSSTDYQMTAQSTDFESTDISSDITKTSQTTGLDLTTLSTDSIEQDSALGSTVYTIPAKATTHKSTTLSTDNINTAQGTDFQSPETSSDITQTSPTIGLDLTTLATNATKQIQLVSFTDYRMTTQGTDFESTDTSSDNITQTAQTTGLDVTTLSTAATKQNPLFSSTDYRMTAQGTDFESTDISSDITPTAQTTGLDVTTLLTDSTEQDPALGSTVYTILGQATTLKLTTLSTNNINTAQGTEVESTDTSSDITQTAQTTGLDLTTLSTAATKQNPLFSSTDYQMTAQSTDFESTDISSDITQTAQTTGLDLTTLSTDSTEQDSALGSTVYTIPGQATTLKLTTLSTDNINTAQGTEFKSTDTSSDITQTAQTTGLDLTTLSTDATKQNPLFSSTDYRMTTQGTDVESTDTSSDIIQTTQTTGLDLTTLSTDATKQNPLFSSTDYRMTAQGTDFESTDISSDITQTAQTTGLDVTTLSTDSTEQDSALGSTVYTIPGQATTLKLTTLSTDNINTAEGTEFESTDTSRDITQTTQTTGLDLTTLSTDATKQNPLFSSTDYRMTAQGTDFESTDISSDITPTAQTTGLDVTTLSTDSTEQDSVLGSTVYTIPGQATTLKLTTLTTDNINTDQGTEFESTDTSSDITQTTQTTGLDLTTLSTDATKQNPLLSSTDYRMTAQGTDFESTDISSDITPTAQTIGLDVTTLSTDSTEQDSVLGSTVYTIPGQATTLKLTTLSTDNINTAQGTEFESTDTSSDITQTTQTTGLDLTTLSTDATKQNPLFSSTDYRMTAQGTDFESTDIFSDITPTAQTTGLDVTTLSTDSTEQDSVLGSTVYTIPGQATALKLTTLSTDNINTAQGTDFESTDISSDITQTAQTTGLDLTTLSKAATKQNPLFSSTDYRTTAQGTDFESTDISSDITQTTQTTGLDLTTLSTDATKQNPLFSSTDYRMTAQGTDFESTDIFSDITQTAQTTGLDSTTLATDVATQTPAVSSTEYPITAQTTDSKSTNISPGFTQTSQTTDLGLTTLSKDFTKQNPIASFVGYTMTAQTITAQSAITSTDNTSKAQTTDLGSTDSSLDLTKTSQTTGLDVTALSTDATKQNQFVSSTDHTMTAKATDIASTDTSVELTVPTLSITIGLTDISGTSKNIDMTSDIKSTMLYSKRLSSFSSNSTIFDPQFPKTAEIDTTPLPSSVLTLTATQPPSNTANDSLSKTPFFSTSKITSNSVSTASSISTNALRTLASASITATSKVHQPSMTSRSVTATSPFYNQTGFKSTAAIFGSTSIFSSSITNYTLAMNRTTRVMLTDTTGWVSATTSTTTNETTTLKTSTETSSSNQASTTAANSSSTYMPSAIASVTAVSKPNDTTSQQMTTSTSTLLGNTSCASFINSTLIRENCLTDELFCRTIVNFNNSNVGKNAAFVSEDIKSCSKILCGSRIECFTDECSLSTCCSGSQCNLPDIERTTTQRDFLLPATFEAVSYNNWTIHLPALLPELDQKLNEYLNSLSPKRTYSVQLALTATNINRCINTGKDTDCFYDVIIKSAQDNLLPMSLESMKSVLNAAGDANGPESLLGMKAYQETESFCISMFRKQLSLGDKLSTQCQFLYEGQPVLYTEYCLPENGIPTLTGEDNTQCPSAFTNSLEDLAVNKFNQTVTELMYNTSEIVSQLVNISGDNMEYGITVLDFVLIVEILRFTLAVEAPSNYSTEDYMTVYNLLQYVEDDILRSAESTNSSVSKLIRNMNKFSDDVQLYGANNMTLSRSSLTVHVSQLSNTSNCTDGYSYSFDHRNYGYSQDTQSPLEVELPKEVARCDSGKRLKFTIYRIDHLFQALIEPNETDSQQTNSWVVSASIGKQKVYNLTNKVRVVLPHKVKLSGNLSTLCTYWDWELSRWSQEGVTLVERTADYTVCDSDHLTHFALLLDVNPYDGVLDEKNTAILTYLSYVGCAISLCGALITLLTYGIHRKLRKDNPSKILMNLAAALALLNLIFLSLTHIKVDNVLCKVAGALLHYSLMSAFAWMAIEGVYMYISLVVIFRTINRLMLKSMLVGWGTPLLVVVITLSIDVNNYQLYNGQLCWLKPEAFFGAVLAPIGVILIMNTIAFFFVVKQIRRMSAKRGSTCSSEARKVKRKIGKRIRGAISVFALLGLTWSMAGLLAVQKAVVFNYIFVIFNSLQGFLLFLFYCVLKKEARQSWRRSLPCFRALLKELSSSYKPTGD